ncbi:MAG: hypothetical protein GXX96_31045 [Planctomycetaceae bacterium]|nr:hypothetical protein [Planctomycetaceae bacterium]
MAKDYNPLTCLPSAEAVRKRLKAAREEARKLRILLQVAEKIEKADDADSRQGVADAE